MPLDGPLLAVVPDEPFTGLEGGESPFIGAEPEPRPRQLVAGDRFVLDAAGSIAAVWGFEKGTVLWSKGEPAFIVGPQGVGKTTLAQRLALARMGLAGDVLGLPIAPDARRVFYLACDRPHQAARSFRRMLSEDERAALAEKLIVWKGPFPPVSAKQPDSLANLCRSVDAGTLFIDSTKDVALELSREETGQVFNLALQYVIEAGVEVLSLHHQRKATGDNKKPTTLADVYGSTWITAGAGSVLLLWGEPGDPIVELRHLKQPAEEFGPANVIFDHARGTVDVHDPADIEALLAAAPEGLTAAVAGPPSSRPRRRTATRSRRRDVSSSALSGRESRGGSKPPNQPKPCAMSSAWKGGSREWRDPPRDPPHDSVTRVTVSRIHAVTRPSRWSRGAYRLTAPLFKRGREGQRDPLGKRQVPLHRCLACAREGPRRDALSSPARAARRHARR